MNYTWHLAVATVICSTIFGAVNAGGQTKTAAAPLPRFEVASVRPLAADVQSAAGAWSWGDVTGRVSLGRILLRSLLVRAYGLQRHQISGPAWLETELFDIAATAPAGTPSEQIRLMFQDLLMERFLLKFHWETRTETCYGLIVAEGGPRLKVSGPSDTSGTPTTNNAKAKSSSADKSRSVPSGRGQGPFGPFKMTVAAGVVHVEFTEMTLKALAEYLSQGMVDLPVVDMTGLRGSYQVPLDMSAADVRAAMGTSPADQGKADDFLVRASDPSGSSVRASLEKLGLKLERRRAPVEKFVIEHIERTPTEN